MSASLPNQSRGFLTSLRTWRYLPDAVGVFVVVLVALLYLSPSLKDGFSFGPTDLVSGASLLTHNLFSGPAHNHLAGDTSDQGVPWNALNWRLVHHGEIPLWNGTAGTGLPQLFNFESAAFALPTLVGYLFPLSASFLVTVLGKLLIAGIGTYVFCRVIGTGAAGATFGGVSFMLSGSFAGWLGWSISGPVSWSGFILAGVALCYRSRGRARDLWLLALSIAFAIYGGFPEMYVVMGAALIGAIGVTALGILVVNRRLELRGVGRVLVGGAAGLALSAPLWLPGISVISHSARSSKHLDGGLVPQLLSLTFAQGYYGLPISGSVWFTKLSNYYESAAYLGIIAIVLAGVALLLSFRRPIVIGITLAGFGTLVLCYHLFGGIGERVTTGLGLGAVAVHRGLPVFGFCVAVLAGIGCDIIVKRVGDRSVAAVFGVMVAAVAVVIAVLWRGVNDLGLTSIDRALRRESLWWPTATAAFLVFSLLFVLASSFVKHAGFRKWLSRTIAATFVSAQAAFLVFAGVGINSYFHQPFPSTPSVDIVTRLVGNGMLAADTTNTSCENLPPARINKPCGVRLWEGYGFIPNVQAGYGLDELGMHDPIIPKTYFAAWPVPDSGQTFTGNVGVFSPAITSAALARRYGVTDVLIPPGVPVPKGMNPVANVPVDPSISAILATVSGSSRFSFIGQKPGAETNLVTSYVHPGDASYTLHTRVPQAATLFLRLTYEPGWHVSANGRSLEVSEYEGMLAVRVPAGTTVVVAHYWPRTFTEGIILSLLALVGLALWPLLPYAGRFGSSFVGASTRRRRGPGQGGGGDAEGPASGGVAGIVSE